MAVAYSGRAGAAGSTSLGGKSRLAPARGRRRAYPGRRRGHGDRRGDRLLRLRHQPPRRGHAVQRPARRDRPAHRHPDGRLSRRRPSSSSNWRGRSAASAACSTAQWRPSRSCWRRSASIGRSPASATAIPTATSSTSRATREGGLDTKLVDRRNGGRRVTWTRRDKDGAVVGTRRGCQRYLRSAHARLVPGRDERGACVLDHALHLLHGEAAGHHLRAAAIRGEPAAGRGAGHRHRAQRAQHLPQEPGDRPAWQGSGDRRQGSRDRLSRPTAGSPIPRKARRCRSSTSSAIRC